MGGIVYTPQIGDGQTWQAVTRTSGVTYTNTTGKPIMLTRRLDSGAGGVSSVISVNGGSNFFLCTAYSGITSVSCCGSIIIPVGATYTITDSGSPATVNTTELR